ncbi:MAG: acyl-CoA thioesterase [Muribaculaceae bacterium]|nr:acyl-CoA thioesterase [Muribaculaceae bacterium]
MTTLDKYSPMPPRTLPPSTNQRIVNLKVPYRHYIPLQTRFTDFDMLGHLNNNVYMAFMDMGKADYFTRVMEGNVDWTNPGVVVVNINCDYFAPVMPGEEIELLTTVDSVGQHSFTMDQRILNASTGEVKCAARTVMVGFDTMTGQSTLIPDAWIKALERYEQREFSRKHDK